jgi:hypothetical protein
MMSQALDNRLPSLESGQEYAPRNTVRDEDWEEYEKGGGELGAVIRRQARRAAPYTRTAQRTGTTPTDITDFDTDDTDDEQDVAELHVNLDFL